MSKEQTSADGYLVTRFGALDVAPPAAANSSFHKEQWVMSLTPEQKDLLSLEIQTLEDSWLSHLKDYLVSQEFLRLKRLLAQETPRGKRWFPPEKDLYSWSRHTPLDKVKVVILGQSPHHIEGLADGLAFSVRPPTIAPPSVRNIFTALEHDYPTFVRPDKNAGSLALWADRGVLLLNITQTVREHDPSSHQSFGWQGFTREVIDLIAWNRPGVVFLAWGMFANRFLWRLRISRHLVLSSVHPSPLSATRGFFDCEHFKQANEWLTAKYGPAAEIDWALTPGTSTISQLGNESKVPLVTDMEDMDDVHGLDPGLKVFWLFVNLPPEIRREIYIMATPPRFVHIQEQPSPGQESFYKFKDYLDQTLPHQLPISSSLLHFSSFWRPKIPDSPNNRIKQTVLSRYGFSGSPRTPSPWPASTEQPRIDPLWLSEQPHLAWHLCRSSRLYSKAPIPPLLHTCRESRVVLIDYGYSLAFATRSSSPCTWFHFGRDSLYIDRKAWSFLPDGEDHLDSLSILQFMPWDLQRVNYLSLSFSLSDRAWDDDQAINQILRFVPNVKHLYCVNCILDFAARQPWSGRGTDIKKVLAQSSRKAHDGNAREIWESVDVNMADLKAESLQWIRLGSRVLEATESWESDSSESGHLQDLLRQVCHRFEDRLRSLRDREGSQWSVPSVGLVNVGTSCLIGQLLREREAYWQGPRTDRDPYRGQ